MRDHQSIFTAIVSSISARSAAREEAGAIATNEAAPYTPRQSGSFVRFAPEAFAAGRRPAGLRERDYIGKNTTARFFAKLTELASASALAYETLRDELAHYGAPTGLLRRLEVARRDEIRHARALTRVARKFGGRALVPEVVRTANRRTLAEIARENASEGCVIESYRTIVTLLQSTNASDADVARIMKKIATDKTRHADLSWAINDWLMTKLSSSEIEASEIAMRTAIADLGNATFDVDAELAGVAGLPSSAACAHIARAFGRELFGQDRAA